MLSRALRRLLRYIWESLTITVVVTVLYALLFGAGLSAFDLVSPNVLAAAGVLAIIGGGSAAGNIRGHRGPVKLKDGIMLREKERFDVAVVGVLLGLLYFEIAAVFFLSLYGRVVLAVAILVPLSIWLADSVRRTLATKMARPPKATG